MAVVLPPSRDLYHAQIDELRNVRLRQSGTDADRLFIEHIIEAGKADQTVRERRRTRTRTSRSASRT
jgi:hypothetical protein